MSQTIEPPYAVDADGATFRREALERSSEVPVVVDFWAAWCGPCRALGPVLEKLASEFAGRFLLVKVDTERAPEISEAFGVRSIPAVFALRDGRVVDSFVGALPESAVRAWIEGLMPSPIEQAVAEADARLESDPEAAEAGYLAALGLLAQQPEGRLRDPKGVEAAIRARRARALVALGRLDEGRAELAALEARGYLEPEAERAKAELDLRARGAGAGDLAVLRAAAEADPADRAASLRLAEALAASGAYPEALGRLLALVEEDRKGTGETARQLMLEVFQLLPPDSDLAAGYRRKLAAALF